MNTRMRRSLLVLLAGILALTGCVQSQPKSTADQSGMTESQVLDMPLEEQYEQAGDHYQELNERFAEIQTEVFADEWRDGSVSSELIPGQGYTRGDALKGDSRENSYYFTVSRWYPTDEDLTPILRDIAESWESRGWLVKEETSKVNGELRIAATTEDGFWFSASEEQSTLHLTGNSPVFWGDRRPLSRAIAERRDAENAAGATWDTADRNDQGHAYRLPGVYRPFPDWNTTLNDG